MRDDLQASRDGSGARRSIVFPAARRGPPDGRLLALAARSMARRVRGRASAAARTAAARSFAWAPAASPNSWCTHSREAGDGYQPLAGLVEFEGALYGMTQYGGTRTPFCSLGCGTIFKIDSRTGAETMPTVSIRTQIARRRLSCRASARRRRRALWHNLRRRHGLARDGISNRSLRERASVAQLLVLSSGARRRRSVRWPRRSRRRVLRDDEPGRCRRKGTIFVSRPAGRKTCFTVSAKPDGSRPSLR